MKSCTAVPRSSKPYSALLAACPDFPRQILAQALHRLVDAREFLPGCSLIEARQPCGIDDRIEPRAFAFDGHSTRLALLN